MHAVMLVSGGREAHAVNAASAVTAVNEVSLETGANDVNGWNGEPICVVFTICMVDMLEAMYIV